MRVFELSEAVAENKIFILKYSDLEDRLDAQFYWEDIDFSNCIKLSRIAKVSGGKRLPKGFDYSKEITNYRYLRIGNINWDSTLEYDKFKYISKGLYTKLKHYEIHDNELLLAIVGATIGKCSLLNIPNDNKIILTENCAKIKITDSDVLPQYLLFLLQSNFVQKQIQLNYIQTTLPKLGLDRVLSLYLPTPPSIKRQEELLDIYQSAFLLKKQKDKQSKELLKSIHTYLLDELNITLPEVDNSLEERIFEVKLSDMNGGRFDPFYYKYCTNVMKSIKYKEFDIIELAYINKGQSITSKNILKGDYPVIGGGQTSPYSHNKFNYESNIITVSASGAYAGYIWYHNYSIFASDCNVLQSKNEEECKTIFLFNILKLKQQELYNLQQGSGQPHVYADDIKKIKIPLPPIEKQNEIVDHIKDIRDKVKQLKQESIQDLKNAKIEVEKMILGL